MNPVEVNTLYRLFYTYLKGTPTMQRLRLFLFILAFVSQQSCQTVKEIFGFGLIKPTVTVQSLTVKRVTLQELDLLVQLRADNPNDIDLNLESLSYQVAVEGAQLASGEYTSGIKIPMESHLKIELPLKLSTQNAFALVQRMLASADPNIQVDFAAQVVFMSPLGPIEFDFKESRPIMRP